MSQLLYVHRAERCDHLADALAGLLADPLPDPFAAEVIAVPAKGVERWLTQRLSLRLGSGAAEDGICAGVRFLTPAALVAEALGRADNDPWQPDHLVWPLLAEIDASLDEPWGATLAQHLGHRDTSEVGRLRRGRRYAVARRISGLFDRYATERPHLLAAWATGRLTDGFDADLPADLVWQAELWRRVQRRLGEPGAGDGGGTRSAGSALPGRVSVFGPTRLRAAELATLAGLAADRDVHLWLPHPSPVLWNRVRESGARTPLRRSADPTVLAARHPLLASLGRDSRELQLALAGYPGVEVHHASGSSVGSGAPPTLLRRLQADLRDDRRPDGEFAFDPADRSIQIHACHGPARQVEVLREVLVGLLDSDPTLEPRDIVVMCPDVEQYAPLIAAAFGLADVVDNGHPGHQLRVRLADRSPTRTNPVLATLAKVLELAGSRLTASQVLDLAAWGPVRQRFGLDDDALQQLSRWAEEASVRWGLSSTDRAPYALDRVTQGTWRAGLDRILLGAAMSEDGYAYVGEALPLDDVGSNLIELAGRLAEFIDRLDHGLAGLRGELPGQQWATALSDLVQSLVAVSDDDAWQLGELHRELQLLGAAPAGTTLTLADVRALLGGRLQGRPTRANFRTGNITVCTMVPMRSVPHRVVCLLGLDDGVFPRGAGVDGDDVLARDPAVGEQDRRGEDRQLLLDAVLAATDTLVVTYSGADERTGSPRPPCVPIGELLDTIQEMSPAAADQVLIRHPLQPFDLANLLPGALGVPGAFSFDPGAYRAALAALGERHPALAFLTDPLPARPVTELDLDDLVEFLLNPVKTLVKRRLTLSVPWEADVPSDALPVELDGLEQWAIGSRLLADRLRGIEPAVAAAVEWRRGALPPGTLGSQVLSDIGRKVEPLVAAAQGIRVGPVDSADVDFTAAGVRVTGTVGGIYQDTVLAVSYSKLGAKEQLQAWVRLVALTLSYPHRRWRAVCIGRGSPVDSVALGPIGQDLAELVAAQLIDLYRRGMTQPLPLPLKTAQAYADARKHGVGPAVQRAEAAWASGTFPGEAADAAISQVWGPGFALTALLRLPPERDENWAGESSRFGELARRLWEPIIAARGEVEL